MAAKRLSDPIDSLLTDWIAVYQKSDPSAYEAWAAFRFETLGAISRPNAFTVPSRMPPKDRSGIMDYVSKIKQIRKSQGWSPDADGRYARGRPAPVDYGEEQRKAA